MRFLCASALLLLPGAAWAQSARTWVSGVGDDVNPCSRTAACKTFAGALAKTKAGGEIDAMAPGDYGAVTIGQALTIDGATRVAGIVNSATSITVQAGANDVVILRNLSMTCDASGVRHIRFTSGRALILENVSMGGCPTGIEVATAADAQLVLSNVSIAGAGVALKVSPTAGTVTALLRDTHISGASTGIDVGNARISVYDSAIDASAVGVHASQADVNLYWTLISRSALALSAENASTIRISKIMALDIGTIDQTATSAVIQSFRDNRVLSAGDSCFPTTSGITPATLADTMVTQAYTQTLGLSGALNPVTYTVTDGALPAGVTLAGNTLSGTPTVAGAASFTISAMEEGACASVARAFTVNVAEAPLPMPSGPVDGGAGGGGTGETPADPALDGTAKPSSGCGCGSTPSTAEIAIALATMIILSRRRRKTYDGVQMRAGK